MAHGLFVLMLVLCTMLAASAQAGEAPSKSVLIIPGVQLGPIRIGMGTSEVFRILGQPRKTRTADRQTWSMDWDTLTAVFLGAYPGGKVVRIITRSPRYATRQGIRVGSPAVSVPVQQGEPVDHEHVWKGGEVVGGVLFYRGMRVEYAGKYIAGRVNVITVEKP